MLAEQLEQFLHVTQKPALLLLNMQGSQHCFELFRLLQPGHFGYAKLAFGDRIGVAPRQPHVGELSWQLPPIVRLAGCSLAGLWLPAQALELRQQLLGLAQVEIPRRSLAEHHLQFLPIDIVLQAELLTSDVDLAEQPPSECHGTPPCHADAPAGAAQHR